MQVHKWTNFTSNSTIGSFTHSPTFIMVTNTSEFNHVSFIKSCKTRIRRRCSLEVVEWCKSMNSHLTMLSPVERWDISVLKLTSSFTPVRSFEFLSFFCCTSFNMFQHVSTRVVGGWFFQWRCVRALSRKKSFRWSLLIGFQSPNFQPLAHTSRRNGKATEVLNLIPFGYILGLPPSH